MGSYTGTTGSDIIRPGLISAGVGADPLGSTPSDASDVINGNGGADTIDGGGGNDAITVLGAGSTVEGGADNDGLQVVYHPSGEVGGAVTGLYGGAGNDGLGGVLDWSGVDSFEWPNVSLSAYGGVGNDLLYQPYVVGDADVYYAVGNSLLAGGTGDDSYSVLDGASLTLIEKPGEGNDFVRAWEDFALPANVENLELVLTYDQGAARGTGNNLGNVIVGHQAANVIVGAAGDDTLFGSVQFDDVLTDWGADRDTIRGGDGDDVIYGAGGKPADTWDSADTLYGDAGNDRIFGQFGDDLIYGGSGNDALAGQAGNDTLYGDAGNDHLGGGSGNDAMWGGAGADALTGREGADILIGGGGNDRFVYESIADSPVGAGNRDGILDFAGVGGAAGDGIDLAQIDADATRSGNQAFVFVGTKTALQAGQLHVVAGDGIASLVQGEVDGQAGVDFEIALQDGLRTPGDWGAGDFIL